MQSISFGDLATSFQSIRSNIRLKAEMQRLSLELTTGKIGDIKSVTAGDLVNFNGIEQALSGLAAYKTSASEAAFFAETVQRSLENVQQITSQTGPALLLVGSTDDATLLQAAAEDARGRFYDVISTLNTKVADRAILAGTATGGTALASADTILAELKTAIAAETTAAGVEAVVDAWFDDPGGGFETVGYLGDATDLAPFSIGPGDRASLSLRADDGRLRDMMKAFSLAALVADDALPGQQSERAALINSAATRLLAADKAMAEMRAGVGSFEARIENAQARNSAETSALEIARTDLFGVDPYQAATELQAVEFQLQSLYTITARLSRLSLTEYLR